MPRAASATRYAIAVFQIALEQGELDRWLDDLTLAARALENRELADYVDAPQVPMNRRIEIVRSALEGSVAPLALNLLGLLASRGIAHVIHDIVEQYQRLLDSHRGVERAEVVSAVELDDEQRRRVAELLQSIVGKEVRMTARVEPQILGGLIARVGDRVIDGSTRGRLNAMRRVIVERVSY
jgi:F-type H+-transporting ATPase subunit delta